MMSLLVASVENSDFGMFDGELTGLSIGDVDWVSAPPIKYNNRKLYQIFYERWKAKPLKRTLHEG